MRAKKGQERTVPRIKFQHSPPAAGVCCLFRPTKYKYRSTLLYTYRFLSDCINCYRCYRQKNRLLPLNEKGFFGELLPKRRSF